MKLVDGYRLARNNLKRTKLRSFLTTAGVVVSIGSIVLLVSLGVGLQKISIDRIASINALTRLTVVPKEGSSTVLNDQTISDLQKVPHVQFVSPEVDLPTRITLDNMQSDVIVSGIKKEYLSFSDVNIDKGNTFSSDNAAEALVSKSVLKLFNEESDPQSAIGKTMQLQIAITNQSTKQAEVKNLSVKIVGTTADTNVSNVYVPLNSVYFPESAKYSSLSIKVSDRSYMKDVKSAVGNMGLETSTVSDLVDQIDQAFLYFQIILGIIGGIALFVAAIGIVNTMTISLLERTHEIGIMKALGARDSDVKRIFLYESAIIGFQGGFLGIVSGWLLGQGINGLIEILLKMNHQSQSLTLFLMPCNFALCILILSTLLSILAGIYPAKRAAKLSPLQALRYE